MPFLLYKINPCQRSSAFERGTRIGLGNCNIIYVRDVRVDYGQPDGLFATLHPGNHRSLVQGHLVYGWRKDNTVVVSSKFEIAPSMIWGANATLFPSSSSCPRH